MIFKLHGFQKIAKAQWKLRDPQAVKKHDDKVNANWKALAQKKLQLPPQIAEHLSKFTTRERSLPAKGDFSIAINLIIKL